MSKITKSLIHTFTGRYAFVIINLISMMTYARMLTPEEIGVHVIAIAASSIIIELRLIGTGSYLIKLKEVKKEDTENVLFVTLCISLFLGSKSSAGERSSFVPSSKTNSSSQNLVKCRSRITL